MRCHRTVTRECHALEVCELQGCQGPAGQALAREREPIDLPALEPLEDPRPGGVMGALMRWQDAGPERARKRHPLLRPFVSTPAPTPAPVAALPAPESALVLEEIHMVMSAPEPTPAAARPAPAPQPSGALTLTRARSGAVVAMVDGVLLDAGTPEAMVEATRAWLGLQ